MPWHIQNLCLHRRDFWASVAVWRGGSATPGDYRSKWAVLEQVRFCMTQPSLVLRDDVFSLVSGCGFVLRRLFVRRLCGWERCQAAECFIGMSGGWIDRVLRSCADGATARRARGFAWWWGDLRLDRRGQVRRCALRCARGLHSGLRQSGIPPMQQRARHGWGTRLEDAWGGEFVWGDGWGVRHPSPRVLFDLRC